jgi:hypothetical protein
MRRDRVGALGEGPESGPERLVEHDRLLLEQAASGPGVADAAPELAWLVGVPVPEGASAVGAGEARRPSRHLERATTQQGALGVSSSSSPSGTGVVGCSVRRVSWRPISSAAAITSMGTLSIAAFGIDG